MTFTKKEILVLFLVLAGIFLIWFFTRPIDHNDPFPIPGEDFSKRILSIEYQGGHWSYYHFYENGSFWNISTKGKGGEVLSAVKKKFNLSLIENLISGLKESRFFEIDIKEVEKSFDEKIKPKKENSGDLIAQSGFLFSHSNAIEYKFSYDGINHRLYLNDNINMLYDKPDTVDCSGFQELRKCMKPMHDFIDIIRGTK